MNECGAAIWVRPKDCDPIVGRLVGVPASESKGAKDKQSLQLVCAPGVCKPAASTCPDALARASAEKYEAGRCE